MPVFDFLCRPCNLIFERFVWKRDDPQTCLTCGGQVEKIWSGKAPGMIMDSIPGGMMIENLDRQPMRFDSKSDYRDHLHARGLTSPFVEGIGSSTFRHTGDPGEGSDKARVIIDSQGKRQLRSTRWV